MTAPPSFPNPELRGFRFADGVPSANALAVASGERGFPTSSRM